MRKKQAEKIFATGRLVTVAAAFFFIMPAGVRAETNSLSAHDILLAADRARGNFDGVAWKVSVDAIEDGITRNTVYSVKARGFDVVAETLEPSRQKGNQLLMHSGNMWFMKPDLSKPVPISQRQRLAGAASNGDLAATNYANDYDPTVAPDAEVDGEACHVFDLKARTTKCTYDRIVYFISRARNVGLRSDYYTSSGKLIKTARMSYTNTVTLADGHSQVFISDITIHDATTTNSVAIMKFSSPQLKALPPETFDINRLRK